MYAFGTSVTTERSKHHHASGNLQVGMTLTDADFNTAIGYLALSSDTLEVVSLQLDGYAALQDQNFTTATDLL